MSSSNEPKPTKKRSGRKRLPPLAPGPALQFVVASHPDDFKADDTMRNIRSHVMYKHRGEQHGVSPGDITKGGERSISAPPTTSTPSPTHANSENLQENNDFLAAMRRRSTIWDGESYNSMSHSAQAHPSRELAARIISATTLEPARSPSVGFGQTSEYPFLSNSSSNQESLEELKNLYIQNTELSQVDQAWLETICSTPMSFLSHVSVACVYHDVLEGLVEDGALTVYAKTKLLKMIKDSLQDFSTSTDDFIILSILHLLVSEFGGFDEDVFDVHQQGLVRIIHQRGGLNSLGHGGIATFLIIVMLSFTIIRGEVEPAMLHGFAPSPRQSTVMQHPPPISPLYPLHGDISSIYGHCSNGTYEIVHDMHELTQNFVARWNFVESAYPPSSSMELASFDISMQQIYTRLLLSSPPDDDLTTDWVYESCRIAALIYCRSIVQQVPLADSANVIHAPSPDTNILGITVIQALHNALNKTDTRSCWGDMSGVFFWVCLVGGAGSCPSTKSVYGEKDDGRVPAAWMRRGFVLHAVKSSTAYGYEHANAVVEAQRTMLQVQSLINSKDRITSQ
ncbi:hypothetical protein K504DRAFT_383318 [Pleomassaria siparia CBS 279.74]|uniref:Transcription factor domain-containing protein n=1 Tax=Pleomassaria siparia CBS 279.74 TaxID=1314801 RepID=A0A6G1K4U4_9PLEO|nr:hypothetical protein K504DRAFT_383318 [Pleomassaria siparia CBS 279.74]